MFTSSYLKSTGQMWKFYLFFMACPMVGLALIFLALNGIFGARVNLVVFVILLGNGLNVVGIVLGLITVKCPKCHVRLLWKAVKEQSYQTWFNWLMGLTKCPVCQN